MARNIILILSCLLAVVLVENTVVCVEELGPPTVEIAQGIVDGIWGTSRTKERKYAAFHMVPYGKAERFEAPEPADSWEGVYIANDTELECAQTMWWTKDHSGKEDCLKLNVYSPDLLTGGLPVMVYFHGGGFTIGGANYYEGKYLMDEDVVVVTVNYRLGAFGFLSTADAELPGNNGLKDQNLALRWVQENIKNFGGDPSSVTIFGNSAGGASVNYQILSPKSAGLFHAGIAQSGSALCPWAFSPKPKEMARRLAKAADCPEEPKELKECLKGKTQEEILAAQDAVNEWGYDPFTPFGPVVEPDLPGAFLTEDPRGAMEAGRFNKVPLITGVVENEGILMHSAFVLHFPELREDLRKNWERILPITLEFNEVYTNFSEETLREMAAKVKNFYFGDKEIGVEETRQELTDAYSDRFFNLGVREAAILMSKYTPVYLYQFCYNGGGVSVTKFFGIEGNWGVSHADECSFLWPNFVHVFPEFEKGSTGEWVSQNFVKLFATFAKEKKPSGLWGNTTWEPISPAEARGSKALQYMKLDVEPQPIPEPFTGRIYFWKDLMREAEAVQSRPSSLQKDEL